MASNDTADGDPGGLSPGQLYLCLEKPERLMRLVCACRDTGELLFKVVDKKWNSAPTPCELLTVCKALRLKLKAEPESIIPSFMYEDDERLKGKSRGEEMLHVRDQYFGLIEPLVSDERLFSTLHPRTSAGVLHARADELGWSGEERKTGLLKLRRLIHRYTTFGCRKNALLPMEWLRGHRGRLVAGPSTKKRGRPNSAVVLGLREYEGVNIKPHHEKLFLQGLEEFYVGGDRSLKRTYRLTVDTLFVKSMTLPDGSVRETKIAERYIPDYEAFRKWARQQIRLRKLDVAKAGHKDGKEIDDRRGRDIDIAPRVGSVYDIDASPGKVELVADFLIENKLVNIGRPQVLLVFDRRSKKIVGWYVYIGNENWRDGYRLAMFSALTSKKADLERLQIDENGRDPWSVNITPEYIYTDGGPGSSKSAYAAFDRLGFAPLLAPPDTPYWKPTVEGGIGWMHSALSDLPGGIRRTNRARDKDAFRLAKKAAKLTLWMYERALVKEIIAYNVRLEMDHLLSHDMRRDSVKGSPNEIYDWGIRRMGGLHPRVLSQVEVYLGLLEYNKELSAVTTDGVRFRLAHYNSEELKLFRLSHPKQRVQLVYHPSREREVYWITPDNTLGVLYASPTAVDAYGTMSPMERTLWHLHNNKSKIIERYKRKPERLTKRQRDLIEEYSGGNRDRQRASPTPNIQAMREVQANKNSLFNSKDQVKTYFPDTADKVNQAQVTARPTPLDDELPGPSIDTAAMWRELKKKKGS